MKAALAFSPVSCLSCLALVLILLAAPPRAAAGPLVTVATLSEDCESMAGLPGGGVVVLTKQNRLLEVQPGREPAPLAVPALPPAQAVLHFTDLAVLGRRLQLCSAEAPVVLGLELPGGKAWSVTRLQLPAGAAPTFARIAGGGGGALLEDTDGGAWGVDGAGQLRLLASATLLPAAPAAAEAWTLARAGEAEGSDWLVRDGSGQELLRRRSADARHLVRNLDVLGRDSRGRLVFIETVGSTEFDNVATLYVGRGTTVEGTLALGGALRALVAKPHVLAGDDSVWLMYPASSGSGVNLARVALADLSR